VSEIMQMSPAECAWLDT